MGRIIHLENPSILIQTIIFCIAITLSAQVVQAQTPPPSSTQDEALEKEAQAIDRMIMCPVCPAETIDQAQVEISFQMRTVIREMLAEGRTREEILDYFIDRYGPDILAAPPKSGVNLLAWILPIVGVAAGLGALYLVVRAMTGRRQPTPVTTAAPSADTSPDTSSGGPSLTQGHGSASASDDPELSPYLEIVDRSLASRRSMRPLPGERPHSDSRPRGNDGDGEGTDG